MKILMKDRFVGSQCVMEEGLIPGLLSMRARWYLADAGVFLSVDAVKNIDPRWKPEAYGYSSSYPPSQIPISHLPENTVTSR
jgi:hypothetical protein